MGNIRETLDRLERNAPSAPERVPSDLVPQIGGFVALTALQYQLVNHLFGFSKSQNAVMTPGNVTIAGVNDSDKVNKLRRLPKNARIQKRPILRPPIPSPYTGAGQKKVVYVSTKMPFISAVKRVRKLLDEIDKRSMGKVDLVDDKGSDKQKLRKLGERNNASIGKEPEEVILKATNRAIHKVLGLALFFQGQDDCRVRLRTGTVGVVDDIVESALPNGADSIERADEEEELPESRVRKASFVEVAINLK